MGLSATALSYGPPVLREKYSGSTIVAEARTAIEDQRSIIGIVPGEGSVLGVWIFNGDAYAFRNKTGGATAGMYKSTSTGWTEIDLGSALNFDGTTVDGEPVPGNAGTPTTITGNTSGASGTLMAISFSGEWTTGAKGAMIFTDVTGTFEDNEDLHMSLLTFDTGTETISEGDTITGATSGKTAVVTSVRISSGAFGDDDATGLISVKDNTGTWTNSEPININGVQHALVDGAAEPVSTKVAVADGALYSQTLNPGGTYEFINYNFLSETPNINMYGVNGADQGFGYDGTTFYKNFTGVEIDTPEHIISHTSHLFYSFPSGTIQHSSIATPNKWSVITGAGELGIGDVVSGFQTEVGDSVTNTLSVFTRNDTYILYGSSSADWALKRFHGGTGAIPFTIQKMGQTFFLDDRGLTSLYTVYNFGDFQSTVASDKIEALMQKQKSKAQTSIRVRAKNQYRLFFSDTTGITLTFINKKNLGIMPFTLSHQINCSCSAEDTNGFEVLYGGFTDGYVRRIDSGTSFDGETVASFIRTAYYHYDTPDVTKRFREVTLEMNADTSTTLTMYPTFDFGGTYSPRTVPVSNSYSIDVTADQWTEADISNSSTGVTAVASERVRINGLGANMGLIIKNSSIYDKPITLQGTVVEYTPRGLRR